LIVDGVDVDTSLKKKRETAEFPVVAVATNVQRSASLSTNHHQKERKKNRKHTKTNLSIFLL
jgi:hypothetical protein